MPFKDSKKLGLCSYPTAVSIPYLRMDETTLMSENAGYSYVFVTVMEY